MPGQLCPHVPDAPAPEPNSTTCEECGATGRLRVCLSCGHVGCCESQQAHNTKHARSAGHPGIRPLPLGGRSWTWCYECDDYVA